MATETSALLPEPDPEHLPFDDDVCRDKLRKVGRSAESIKSTSVWVFHHRHHLQRFVKIWISEFRKASPKHRLSMYYVAHETLALCKRKRYEKGFTTFQSVLREATVYSRDKECKNGVRKVLNIFADASFFPEEFIKNLRDDLEKGKSMSNYNKVVLNDFDLEVLKNIHEQVGEFRTKTLEKLETQMEGKNEELEYGDQIIAKVKEHAKGKDILDTFDKAFGTMEELEEAREQDLKYDYDLLNQLELLRIHYSTTAKEAGKVILAYGNYETVLKNGVHLLEKSQSLLSIPMPALPTAPRQPAKSWNGTDQANTSIDTIDMDMGSDDEKELELPRMMEESFPPPRKSPSPSKFSAMLSSLPTTDIAQSPISKLAPVNYQEQPVQSQILSPPVLQAPQTRFGPPPGGMLPHQQPPLLRGLLPQPPLLPQPSLLRQPQMYQNFPPKYDPFGPVQGAPGPFYRQPPPHQQFPPMHPGHQQAPYMMQDVRFYRPPQRPPFQHKPRSHLAEVPYAQASFQPEGTRHTTLLPNPGPAPVHEMNGHEEYPDYSQSEPNGPSVKMEQDTSLVRPVSKESSPLQKAASKIPVSFDEDNFENESETEQPIRPHVGRDTVDTHAAFLPTNHTPGFTWRPDLQNSPPRKPLPQQSFITPYRDSEIAGNKRRFEEQPGDATGANTVPVARVNFQNHTTPATEDIPLHERLRRLAEGNAANKNIVTLTSSSARDRHERR
ncbi:hypothetical protein RvY_17437 [Ramazzottius varieornatus]|uniref:CID domain-containing protein n=1 Tax=Ramazzottius varieornatus TaxID=947166 RepID=A0A1D1W2I7_RAMVA|nr:hypothetical protein RvY_17437 [Ramazzottius varieornatus]